MALGRFKSPIACSVQPLTRFPSSKECDGGHSSIPHSDYNKEDDGQCIDRGWLANSPHDGHTYQYTDGVKQSILQTLRLPACKEGRYDNRGNLDCIENVDCIGNPHVVQKVKIREAQSYAGSRYTS